MHFTEISLAFPRYSLQGRKDALQHFINQGILHMPIEPGHDCLFDSIEELVILFILRSLRSGFGSLSTRLRRQHRRRRLGGHVVRNWSLRDGLVPVEWNDSNSGISKAIAGDIGNGDFRMNDERFWMSSEDIVYIGRSQNEAAFGSGELHRAA